MTKTQRYRVLRMLAQLSIPRWSGSVADYCAGNLRFREPKLSGPFSFAGREYMREMLDTWGDESVRDQVYVMGTRTGKTRAIFGGLAWRIHHNPTRALYVMPNSHGTGGAQNVSRTRFQPMLRASPALSKFIPTGAKRHDFKTLQMIVNGSIIDLAGSNSPANLAGNPCDCVVQDETDKYQIRGEKEAHPSRLADERAKEFANPKRIKASTPTLYSGLIWQEFLKTDMRRRFVPCPFCGKSVVFAWSEQFTVMPKCGDEAYVKWDKEARNPDGTWDEKAVQSSAHAECPHCKGKIRDPHKVEMDRQGEWRATKEASPGFRGWHLPSMYSVSSETTFGRMAVRFIQAQQSLLGLQNFINSDLAEPFMNQDVSTKRVGLVVSVREIGSDGVVILVSDYQAKAPYLWWVARRWYPNGDSVGIACGSCMSFDELREVQTKHSISDSFVVVDSGFDALEVYKVCIENSHELGSDGVVVGWLPVKGSDRREFTQKDKTTSPVLMVARDPYQGTSRQGIIKINLLHFSEQTIKDILHAMRTGRGGYKWAVSDEMATEQYWKHMDSNIKKTTSNKRNGREVTEWQKRSHWPDHLFDCEVMQVAYAFYLGLLKTQDDQ